MVISQDRYLIGEFWTSRQRQANRIHEVSYRACFKPQLPRFFIKRFTEPGDIIYDPFMGRGTTPIEAALIGRIPYGNDASPLSRVLTEPRINPPTLLKVQERLQNIDWWIPECLPSRVDDMLVFYHIQTLHQIYSLRKYFRERKLDKTDQWIRMVATNRLSGHSPGFFSVRTMPPNQAVSINKQKRLNEKHSLYPEEKNIAELILKKTKYLLSQKHPVANDSMFLTRLSEQTPEISDGIVALTVTSPPFLDIVDYEKDNWLRNWFLELDSPKLSIYKKVDEWRNFTQRTLKELCRITKSLGYIAYEVGEVRNRKLLLEEVVVDAAVKLPLELIRVYINQQDFTKTANCWGIRNNTKGTNTNRILLFQRNP